MNGLPVGLIVYVGVFLFVGVPLGRLSLTALQNIFWEGGKGKMAMILFPVAARSLKPYIGDIPSLKFAGILNNNDLADSDKRLLYILIVGIVWPGKLLWCLLGLILWLAGQLFRYLRFRLSREALRDAFLE